MTQPPSGVLTAVPIAIAVLSRRLRRAIITLLREVARAISSLLKALGRLARWFVRWIWSVYRKVESRLASLICDLLLIFHSSRFLIVLAGIGAVLGIWRLWSILALYVLLFFVAVVAYGRAKEEDARAECEANSRYRAWLIPKLEWALRIAVTALAFAYLNAPWIVRIIREDSGSHASNQPIVVGGERSEGPSSKRQAVPQDPPLPPQEPDAPENHGSMGEGPARAESTPAVTLPPFAELKEQVEEGLDNGHYDRALLSAERAVRLYPDNDEARQLLEKVHRIRSILK